MLPKDMELVHTNQDKKPFEIGERVYYVYVDKDGYTIHHVLIHQIMGDFDGVTYSEATFEANLIEVFLVIYQHYYDAGVEWIHERVVRHQLFRTQKDALDYARKKLKEINEAKD